MLNGKQKMNKKSVIWVLICSKHDGIIYFMNTMFHRKKDLNEKEIINCAYVVYLLIFDWMWWKG